MTLSTLGKYTLYESLGRGGYGTVYRAQEPVLQVVRAVKVLHQELLADPQFIERFRLEARTAARLEHPHIVPVYELSQDQGRYFLAMKYMPGGSLKELLEKDGRLAFPRALEITRQVASALEYAHKQGVVHRDVKPANILFDEDGSVRLSDFGFSRAMQASSSGSISASGGVIGTPQYIAPEIWRGKPATPAADVYSLACVFIEMLTGQVLFSGDSPAEIMTRHILDGPQFPQAWPEGTPAHIEAVLAKALASRPQERYAGPGEFTAALQLAAPASAGERSYAAGEAEPPVPPHVTAEPAAGASQEKKMSLHLKAALLVFIGPVILVGLLWAALKLEEWYWITQLDQSQSTSQPAADLAAQSTQQSVVLVDVQESNAGTNAPGTSTSDVMATPVDLPTPISTALPTPTVDPRFPPAEAQLGDTWISPVDGMELVFIPAGEFLMGCDPAHNDGYDCPSDELPLHTVTLDEFWIDKTEVTNAQYAMCVAAGACDPPRDEKSVTGKFYYGQPYYVNFPVVNVSWQDANHYCAWAGRELPTEAQWEKAARGTNPQAYPWGDASPTCDLVNGEVNGEECKRDMMAVGSYPTGASPYGVLDMAGNVIEWVRDWYSPTYYGSLDRFINPLGPDTGVYKVQRGGNGGIYPSDSRTAIRDYQEVTYGMGFEGFRCAFSQLMETGDTGEHQAAEVLDTRQAQTSLAPALPTDITTTNRTNAISTPTVNPKIPPSSAQLGDTWTSPVDGMELVYIPAGDFIMGCYPAGHNDGFHCPSSEIPWHAVTLDTYWMDKTEVTNAQYAQCVADGACVAPSTNSSYTRSLYYNNSEFANYPVLRVSWYNANDYCIWAGRELPTEAQWEKAARGTDKRAYPWGDASPSCDVVNGLDCGLDTMVVGSYPKGASPYGLLDMAGNVWEWVRDWYSGTYYSSQVRSTNPVGPNMGLDRVIRGGGFASIDAFLRTANRSPYNPEYRGYVYLGFRCAFSPEP